MKRSIFVVISIILAVLVTSACSSGISYQSAAQATPNMTLTALFNTSLEIPATVTPIYIIVTSTPEPVTPTATETETATPTEEPTEKPTNTPVNPGPNQPVQQQPSTDQRTGAVMEAGYISFDPDIDGSWSEWKDYTTQYTVSYVVYGANHWSGSDDLEASYAAVWDYDYLYIGVKVHDDKYVQNAEGQFLYEGDSIEILLDTNLNGDYYYQALSSDDYQLGISAGNDDDIDPEAFLWFPSSKAGSRSNVDIGFTVDADGVYRYEVRIPWSVFGVTPSSGMRLGIAVSVSDNDDPNKNVQQTMVSSARYRVLTNPTTWGIIVLDK